MGKKAVFNILAGIFIGASITILLTHFDDAVSEKETVVEGGSETCFESSLLSDLVCSKKFIDKTDYIGLNLKLNQYIEHEKQAGTISEIGIYFRDLMQGPTLGINEYIDFSPASLFKLPLLMQYLSLVEQQPDILRQQLKANDDLDVDSIYEQQNYKVQHKIVAGQVYTIEELLTQAIVYSDNVAVDFLNGYLVQLSNEANLLEEVYSELGLVPDFETGEFSVPVKRYASLFRILFTATYLSPEMSHYALNLLAQSTFNNGLRAGVPTDVLIAHKFGERVYVDTDGKRITQLHDCGIVYFPNNPYVLCVMTRGDDFKDLEHVIGTVSKMFFEEVTARIITE